MKDFTIYKKIISLPNFLKDNYNTLTAFLEACFNELCKHFYLNFKLMKVGKSELSHPSN